MSVALPLPGAGLLRVNDGALLFATHDQQVESGCQTSTRLAAGDCIQWLTTFTGGAGSGESDYPQMDYRELTG